MNFYLTSVGCKLNQAEIEALARTVEARGYQVVADPALADWAILNTCTVTHVAARKSRQLIRQLLRASPNLRLAVTGCYAEISPEEAQALGVDLVISNTEKDQLIERILALVPEASPDLPYATFLAPHRLALGHTRAMVKIQDGCENHCTYCIVHVARGPQRSVTPQGILDEVCVRLAEGHREIVLTGVNIGAYGRDRATDGPLPPSAGWSLTRLVRLLLDETSVERLRLSSIEPWDVTDELLDLWADPRLCRHLHLPLQSGCDATLRRMARRYTTERFARLAETIREHIPDVSLTTDVIVGFPGETDSEFEETRHFIEAMQFSRLHVFKYSPRPGTPAAEMPGPVDPRVAQARSEMLIGLGRRLAREFHERFIGQSVHVLFETPTGARWEGLTDNYLRVTAEAEGQRANSLATVRCLHADEEGLQGELA